MKLLFLSGPYRSINNLIVLSYEPFISRNKFDSHSHRVELGLYESVAPPSLMVLYRKFPLGAHGSAAHQRYCPPSPATDTIGHCRRLQIPLRQKLRCR